MGRKKIKITYIVDDRKRTSTFEKRRIGLFKKASELNQLCGVNISVIIVNRNSIYRFSDVPETLEKTQFIEHTEKIEEDFNNDSLSEFINKKMQKSTNTNGSNSIDHQSVCEDQKNVSTDDELDPGFINVLVQNSLFDHYKNMKPDISPDVESTDLIALTDSGTIRSDNNGHNNDNNYSNHNSSNNDNVHQSVPLAFNFDNTDQSHESIYRIPSINRLGMNNHHPEIMADSDSYSQTEPFYSELTALSGSNSNYVYNASHLSNSTNDCVTNSRWRNHKSDNPRNCELIFNATSKYNITINDLETPIFESMNNNNNYYNNNNEQPLHLHNDLPSNFHDLLEGPLIKRQKILIDSPEGPYRH